MSFLNQLNSDSSFLDVLLDEEDKNCWQPEGHAWRLVVEKLVEEMPLQHIDGTLGEI